VDHAVADDGGGHARDAEGIEVTPALRLVLDVKPVERYPHDESNSFVLAQELQPCR
jgi:hypothetical protein